jgi:hypothetical protein
MRRGLVLVVALFVLTGCHEQWGSGSSWSSGSGSADDDAAMSNVRASIPAIEAYYADNGTYAGATLEGLRSAYDPALPEVDIVEANDQTYCVESTVGSVSYFKAGPAADIWPGRCGDDAPPPQPPPPATHTDAEDLVLSVIPAIEAYHAQNGTYAGLEQTREVNGVSLSQVRIYVRKGGAAYCVEGPRQAASAHFVGPSGPLAPGPC